MKIICLLLLSIYLISHLYLYFDHFVFANGEYPAYTCFRLNLYPSGTLGWEELPISL
jgi:hypothetical protein